MAQYGSPAVFPIKELVHEHMNRCAERVERKVPHVFCKREQCKRCTERKMSKCGLIKILSKGVKCEVSVSERLG